MTIYYNVTDRKPLVKAISEFTGAEAVYMRTPTYAYKIDYFTVTREGNVEFDDMADSEEIENLIETLAQQGFVAERSEYDVPMPDIKVEEPLEDCPPAYDASEYEIEEVGISIGFKIEELGEVSVSEETVNKLRQIVASRKMLFQKAIATNDDFNIEIDDGAIWFDWFGRNLSREQIKIYTEFVKGLYRMAEQAKRVTAREKALDNEKFAMRTFLNRLGFIGDEYKPLRKELLKNLSGNSAFRYGKNA